jgi:hypothetical protein
MRSHLTLLFVLTAIAVSACSKATPTSPTPTNPPVSTPPPSPAPPVEPTPPAGPPPPSINSAVYTTLNAAGTVTGSLDVVWSERAGSDRQVYDDFVIAGGATIRTISWQGRRDAARPITRIYVAIMADGGDRHPARQYADQRPVALWSATYAADQVNERLEVSVACENAPQTQCGYYDYSVGMMTPFVATAGTRYWLMIQAESSLAQETGFCWRKGTRDNGFSTGNIAGTTHPWDMAFALRP